MITFLVRGPSEEFAWDYANRIREDGGPPAQVLCYEDLLKRQDLPSGTYVFTGLNRFGTRMTEATTKVYEAIASSPGSVALNHPGEALGRYELLRALDEAGLNQFTLRGAWEDLNGLRFPVFVRDRSEDGGIPELLGSMKEVEAAIGWAIVRGADVSELIVVEYRDTRCEDGLFRKYSAYFVGETILPVSLECGTDWVLRYPVAKFSRETLEEERSFVFGDPHADQLREVRAISKVGFGRIDYSLLEGRVQTWEINTLPTMRHPAGSAPIPADLRPHREAKMRFFKSQFRDAWRALDPEGTPPRQIQLDLPESVAVGALKELSAEVPGRFRQPDRYSSIKSVLRPVKSMIMPFASKTVIPVFAKGKMKKALRDSRSGVLRPTHRTSRSNDSETAQPTREPTN